MQEWSRMASVSISKIIMIIWNSLPKLVFMSTYTRSGFASCSVLCILSWNWGQYLSVSGLWTYFRPRTWLVLQLLRLNLGGLCWRDSSLHCWDHKKVSFHSLNIKVSQKTGSCVPPQLPSVSSLGCGGSVVLHSPCDRPTPAWFITWNYTVTAGQYQYSRICWLHLAGAVYAPSTGVCGNFCPFTPPFCRSLELCMSLLQLRLKPQKMNPTIW